MIKDDHRPGDDGVSPNSAPAGNLLRRRRGRMAIGVAGLAAVLGAGSYLTTTWLTADNDTTAQDVPVVTANAPATEEAHASATPSGSSAPGSSSSPSAAATTGGAQAANPETPAPRDTRSAEERIKAARDAAAKDGFPLRRALEPAPGLPQGSLKVRNSGSLKEGGTMRVITAKYNLEGQRELLWAADKGEKVGIARCTQTFRFSNNMTPKERPTLLLCWKTSPTRSVATVAVAAKGRPDKAESVAIIKREWEKLE
ncbi:hypothetical protein [Actinoplanes sp. NPDC049802]|uniref:hypothetical protein n=1 Tax=Actinoplanes sp. NPDC049802 TaxID=3154742 RepID=UPI0034009F4B